VKIHDFAIGVSRQRTSWTLRSIPPARQFSERVTDRVDLSWGGSVGEACHLQRLM